MSNSLVQTIEQLQQKAADARLSNVLQILEEIIRHNPKYCTNTKNVWTCDLSGIDQYLAFQVAHHKDFPIYFKKVIYAE
jgi:hypothetical protein